jgi:hypothetical protein
MLRTDTAENCRPTSLRDQRGKLGGYLPQRPLPTLRALPAKLLGEGDHFRS